MIALFPGAAPAQSPSAQSIAVSTTPVTTFKATAVGDTIDALTFRGGLVLTAPHPAFGGLSGLAFLDGRNWVAVSDQGQFFSGALELADGAPAALSDVEIDVIRNSAGNPLPTKFSSDSEAIEVIVRDGAPAAVRVGFENLARLADFDVTGHRPGGAAREVPIPQWLTDLRTNESIESVCIAPPASPVAGSTLIIAEGHSLISDTWAATLLGDADRGDLALAKRNGLNPTDCAFLPNGDLLVLERGFAFLTFTVQLRRISADQVRAGAVMEGEVLLNTAGGDVDNFEALGVRTLPGGEVRATIVSDNNFNGIQRTLLLDFALPH